MDVGTDAQTNNGSDSDSPTTPAIEATTHIVKMTGDYEFVPSSLTIKQGDSVKWVVAGTKAHEVASGTVIEGEDGKEGVPDGLWKTGKMASGALPTLLTLPVHFLTTVMLILTRG